MINHGPSKPYPRSPAQEFAMSVLAVTIFVSMMLALFFVAGFIYHHDFSGGDSVRDSLLPFKPEKPASGKEPGYLPTGLPTGKPDSNFPRP